MHTFLKSHQHRKQIPKENTFSFQPINCVFFKVFIKKTNKQKQKQARLFPCSFLFTPFISKVGFECQTSLICKTKQNKNTVVFFYSTTILSPFHIRTNIAK